MFDLHETFPRQKVIILLTSKSNFKPEICVWHLALLCFAWFDLAQQKQAQTLLKCVSLPPSLLCCLTGGIYCFSFFYVSVNATKNLMHDSHKSY